MRTGILAWALTLAGLIFWAIHFGGLYTIVSWMDLNEANATPGRWIAGVFSGVCLLTLGAAAVILRREKRLSPDLRWIALVGVVVAALAVLFQTAPLLLV